MEPEMDRNVYLPIAATLAAVLLTPALAQAPPKPNTPIAPKAEQLDPSACANGEAQTTIGQGGDVEMKKPGGRSLSNKLARSQGVICPPQQVDPEIRQPTPPGGSMPVIPPPGSPGGDPSVHRNRPQTAANTTWKWQTGKGFSPFRLTGFVPASYIRPSWLRPRPVAG
jgi:hypothetical protein